MFALAMVACVDQDPEIHNFPDPDVDFTYNVSGDEYTLDYYVVSTIQFNNTSSKTGAITWNFGDGQTSNEENPLHKYDTAGLYQVTLTIDGVGSRTYPLLIYDIAPTLSIEEQSTDIIEINVSTVSFKLELPNPESLKCKFVWSFPDGTTDESGQSITSFTGYSDENGNIDYPGKVMFSNIGSQKVEIKTWFDVDGENRQLEDSYLNVQVACSYEAPTLYYAKVGGNIMALKIVDTSLLPEGTKVYPYDMGVSPGDNCFQLAHGETTQTDDETGEVQDIHWIYILDAGKQYYYVNDEAGTLGDGKITAMASDGTNVNTVITNVGGAAFNDPFQGFVADGKIYYSDRNTGISEIEENTRGAVQGANSDNNRDSYFVYNSVLSYYNRGIGYGAIHTGHVRDSSGVWYWGKNYSGNGIYRFTASDIYSSADAATAAGAIPHPILLSGIKIKAFNIDEQRQKLYVWRSANGAGFYEYPLPALSESLSLDGDVTAKVELSAKAVNTTSDEGVYVTQFAVDETTGYVYFGFRPDDSDSSGLGTGIVYYDPETQKCQRYGETSAEAQGIVINPTLSKLF